MIRRSWTRAASIEETLALWAASLREVKKRIRPLFRQERVATNAGLFPEGLLGDEQRKTGWMRAEAAGDPGPWRQQAILGRMDWDADALRDIVRDYVIEHLADAVSRGEGELLTAPKPRAVSLLSVYLAVKPVGEPDAGDRHVRFRSGARDRRDRLSQAGQSVVRSGAAIHWLRRQDHELPDRGLRCLRFALRSCVHRSRAVSSKAMDRRSRSPGSRIRAPGCRLCDQTKACDENDRRRHSRVCPIQVGGWRYGLRCWRYRTAITSRRQRLCTRGQQRSCIPFLGQAAVRRWQGRRHRPDAARVRLETPVGRGRNQRTAAA